MLNRCDLFENSTHGTRDIGKTWLNRNHGSFGGGSIEVQLYNIKTRITVCIIYTTSPLGGGPYAGALLGERPQRGALPQGKFPGFTGQKPWPGPSTQLAGGKQGGTYLIWVLITTDSAPRCLPMGSAPRCPPATRQLGRPAARTPARRKDMANMHVAPHLYALGFRV